MLNRKRILVYAGLILTMLFWSLSYIWIKMVYIYINPITTVFLRLTATAVILLVFAKITKKLQKIQRGDLKFIIFMTFLHPLAYFTFESFGLKYASSTTAAVIISTIPLFIPIAAFYLFNERLSKTNITGMVISFTGVILVIVKKDFSLAASPLGMLLLFLAVISGVAFTISLRKLTIKYNPVTLITYQNLLGVFWFAPLFVIFELEHFLTVPITIELIGPLAMLIIFASTLAFIFYAAALQELGAAKAGIFGNIMPAFTAVFAWFLLSETLTVQKMVGIAIVITGLLVSQIRKRNND
ncbi:MAG: DMT family transporter [bacterium]|nr:DMT family transporter [bacterium]